MEILVKQTQGTNLGFCSYMHNPFNIRTALIVYHLLRIFIQLASLKFKLISENDFGIKLTKRIEKLDGIFIKIGQLLCTRPDVVPPQSANHLKRLLQKTNPIPFAQIENTIKELLKERYSLFDIEKQPLASASIAQVHRATFNGEKVVLKIVKPGIPELFEKDLRVLRAFMKMGTFFPFLANLPIMELYKELEEIILPQTDLLNEKKNLMKIKGNLLDFKDIAIPEIYKEGNSSKLLIMEFMNFPNEVDFDDWEMDKRIRTSNQILEMLFQMMFVDGLTHCDMHQGNLFIDYSGKLILLDFGMVTSMTKEETADFVRFFYHMSMNNGYQCAEILEKKAIFLSKKYSREKFFHEIEMFINKHWSLNVIDFETSLFTLEMIRIQNQNGIKGSTAFIHNILSIVFLEGILKNINPQLDFQLAAKKFIIRNKLKIK